MKVASKQVIDGEVSEINESYAVVRDANCTDVYNLDWYRIQRGEHSMVELKRPDGNDVA